MTWAYGFLIVLGLACFFIGICAMLMIDRQFIYKAQDDQIRKVNDRMREIELQLEYFDLKTEDWEPQQIHLGKNSEVVAVYMANDKFYDRNGEELSYSYTGKAA